MARSSKPEGGSDGHRELAHSLQHAEAAFRARLPTTGTAHHRAIDTAARRNAKHPLVSQLAWYKILVGSQSGHASI